MRQMKTAWMKVLNDRITNIYSWSLDLQAAQDARSDLARELDFSFGNRNEEGYFQVGSEFELKCSIGSYADFDFQSTKSSEDEDYSSWSEDGRLNSVLEWYSSDDISKFSGNMKYTGGVGEDVELTKFIVDKK